MLDWDDQKRFIVYPPWARFSYPWSELGILFAKSEEQWASFGYKLNASNYNLRDGAFGGGVIEKRGELGYWSPLKVLLAEAESRPIFNMSRIENWWVSVLIPKITAEHKLGLETMPPAPSPGFSVERIDLLTEHAYVAVGCSVKKKSAFKPDHFVVGLRHLGVKCGIYAGDPVISPKDYAIICPQGLKFHWIQIQPEQWSANALLAFVVYTGMHFTTPQTGALTRVHLLSAFREFPQLYGSCRTWPIKLATAETARDW